MIALFCLMFGSAEGQHSAAVIDDFFRFTNAYQAEKVARC